MTRIVPKAVCFTATDAVVHPAADPDKLSKLYPAILVGADTAPVANVPSTFWTMRDGKLAPMTYVQKIERATLIHFGSTKYLRSAPVAWSVLCLIVGAALGHFV